MNHSIIIGGTRGSGKFLVEKWGKLKSQALTVAGRTPPSGISWKRKSNVEFVSLDLSRISSLGNSLKEMLLGSGPVDNLIFFQRFRGEISSWQGELDTSLTATKLIIDALSDSFRKSGPKSIVIVGSMAGRMIAYDCDLGYHVAKAGLEQMVRYYAVTLAKRGIRVNGVIPGEVMKEESKVYFQKNKKLLATYNALIPLGRMGNPSDVAHVIDFLCSPGASYMTGQNLIVDGGLSLLWQGSLAKNMGNRE